MKWNCAFCGAPCDGDVCDETCASMLTPVPDDEKERPIVPDHEHNDVIWEVEVFDKDGRTLAKLTIWASAAWHEALEEVNGIRFARTEQAVEVRVRRVSA